MSAAALALASRLSSTAPDGEWRTPATFGSYFYGAAVSTDGVNVWMTHGYSGSTNAGVTTGLRIDPTTGVITTMSNSDAANSTGRYAVAGAWANGKHYAIGGLSTSGNIFNTVATARLAAGTPNTIWESAANYPLSIMATAAVTVGSVIYVVGGQTANSTGSAQAAVYRLDTSVATPAWVACASLPAPRGQGGLVAIGRRLYYFGGYNGSGSATGNFYIYDIDANTWSASTVALPVNSGSTAAVAYGTTVYLLLRNDSNGAQQLVAYNTVTNTFTKPAVQPPTTPGPFSVMVIVGNTLLIPSSNTRFVQAINLAALAEVAPPTWRGTGQYLTDTVPRTYFSLSSDGTRGYITGGYYYSGSVGYYTDGYVILATGAIVALASNDPSTSRYEPMGGNAGGRHYAFGGINNSAPSGGNADMQQVVTAYTPAGTNGTAGTWSTRASLPAGRARSGVAELNGFLYVAGGISNYSLGLPTESFYRYDFTNNVWTTLASLPTQRQNLMLLPYGGKLYAVGGYGDSPTSASLNVYAYNPTTNTWSTVATLPTAVSFIQQYPAMIGSVAYSTIGGTLYAFDCATLTLTTTPARSSSYLQQGGQQIIALSGDLLAIGGQSAIDRLTPSDAFAGSTFNRKLKGVQQYLASVDPVAAVVAAGVPNPPPRFAVDAFATLQYTNAYGQACSIGNTGYWVGGLYSSNYPSTAPTATYRAVALNLPATTPIGLMPDMPGNYRSAGVLVPLDDGSLLLTGGAGGNTGPASGSEWLDAYRLPSPGVQGSSGAWGSVAAPPVQRVFAAGLADGTRALVVGGQSGAQSPGSVLGTIAAYTRTTNTWSTLSGTMATPRTRAATARDSTGRVYACGGMLANGTGSAVVERYNPATSTWSTLASLPAVCQGAQALIDNLGFLWVLGGADGSGTTDAGWYRYDPTANTWTVQNLTMATLWTFAYQAVKDAAGRFHVLGGTRFDSATSSTIYQNFASQRFDPLATTRYASAVAATKALAAVA